MESNPDIALEAVKETVLAVPEIKNIHHVHIWRFSGEQIMMDAHINVDSAMTVSELETIYDKVAEQLYNKFTINHVTLQAECRRGADEQMIEIGKND